MTKLFHKNFHRRYEEQLFFVVVSSSRFTQETLSELQNLLGQDLRLNGFSIYPVLGTWDIVVRVWFDAPTFSRASRKFDELKNSGTWIDWKIFQVKEFNHWAVDTLSDARATELLEEFAVDYSATDIEAIANDQESTAWAWLEEKKTSGRSGYVVGELD